MQAFDFVGVCREMEGGKKRNIFKNVDFVGAMLQ